MIYKKISLLLTLFILGTTFNLSAQSNTEKKRGIENQNDKGAKCPELKIEVSAAKVVTNKDLASDSYFFLIVVNPTCGHCINEAKLICDNADLFKGVKVAFMTTKEKGGEIPEFKTKTGLDKHPDFITGTDQAGAVQQLPLSGMFPHILVYDKNRNLVTVFNGDTPLDNLKQYLP